MQRVLFLFLSILFATFSYAGGEKVPYPGGKCWMFRVYLKDKAGCKYSVDNPEAFLSPKALERRRRQGLAVDFTDLPVSDVYLSDLRRSGFDVVCTSKWNNTVLLRATDSTLVDKLGAMPFVSSWRHVFTSSDSLKVHNNDFEISPFLKNNSTKYKGYYGKGERQIALHHGDSLHAAGYRGAGITIAVLDGGFSNVDRIPAFANTRILGTRNFIWPGEESVYRFGAHGTEVLSTIAANDSNRFVGTAPEASFYLFCTEDGDTETPTEEDYWSAAAEYADSLGVDILSSSLGYHTFHNKADNYRYCDLDGHKSLCSNSASMLADKGMILVCSAGNEGRGSWKKITVPADAENVITVGALNKDTINTAFSSIGPTSDGRVKPDVMAIGGPATVISESGTLDESSGTSFACPLTAGLVACLWQARPELNAKDLIKLIQQSGDRADCPDNIFGYGVPDMWKAAKTR